MPLENQVALGAHVALENHVALEAVFLQILLLLRSPQGTLDPPLKPALLELPLVRLCWVEPRCVSTHHLLGPLGASEAYYLCSSPLHQYSS